jgi:cobalt-zinc-cadmium efflux system membrane fusion protein
MSRTPSWPVLIGAMALAGGAGFGIAQLTRTPPAAEAPEAPAAAADVLAVTPAQLSTMGIAVETAAPSSFSAALAAPGSVVAAPGGEAVVTAQAAGAITRLNKRLGDPVRAGEVLALVASREAAGMAADRQAADARANLARATLAREKSLFDQRVSPRQDYERAQAELAAAEAEARRARTVAATARLAGDGRSLAVVSPISGRVTETGATLGGYVQPDAELFHIADPSRVQVEAALPAADAARIRPGDPARVTTSAGQSLAATVRTVTPSVSAETRAATVVLALAAGAAATPGDAVRVEITSTASAGAPAIAIPEEAVQSVNGRDVVFVRTPAGFKVQPVTVAARGGGRASIASGLVAGQAVATRNAFVLKAELTKSTEDEE